MDFGVLTVPLTMLSIAFGFAVFTDTQSIHFEYVDVPEHVATESGYSSAVVIARIADEMKQIAKEADTTAGARQVDLGGGHSASAVLGDYVGVTPLIRVVQQSLSLIPFSFAGEIVNRPDHMEMKLRGHGADHHAAEFVVKADPHDIQGLIHGAGYEAMRIVNPYILAAYQFKRDRLTRDFTSTLEIINREVGGAHGHGAALSPHAQWMYNLWGIVLYQQGDFEGAIEKFHHAKEIDKYFLSPMLNEGVVYARIGKHDKAIEQFRAVTTSYYAGYNKTAVAAAYSEWGFSLALLGQFNQAYSKFEQAVSIDPNFADVYTSWAEVLSAAGRRQEAGAMTVRAVQLAPVETVHTENLIGSVQRLPALASSSVH
jgi:hypothetical protein